MNEIGDHKSSARQYLAVIGAGKFRLTMKDASTAHDWWEGVWHSSYTNSHVNTIHQAARTMPEASPSWSSTDNAMNNDRDNGPGGCPGSASSSYCHYIPDDVSSGCQWAHRHNAITAGEGAGEGDW